LQALTVKQLSDIGFPENLTEDIRTSMADVVRAENLTSSSVLATYEFLKDLYNHPYLETYKNTLDENIFQIMELRYIHPLSYIAISEKLHIGTKRIREAIHDMLYVIYMTSWNATYPFPEYEELASSTGKYVKGDISTYTFLRNSSLPEELKNAVITLISEGILGNMTNLSHPQAFKKLNPRTVFTVSHINWIHLALLEWLFSNELGKRWFIDSGLTDSTITPLALKIWTKIWKSQDIPIISKSISNI
jgi:hypothetical protein